MVLNDTSETWKQYHCLWVRLTWTFSELSPSLQRKLQRTIRTPLTISIIHYTIHISGTLCISKICHKSALACVYVHCFPTLLFLRRNVEQQSNAIKRRNTSRCEVFARQKGGRGFAKRTRRAHAYDIVRHIFRILHRSHGCDLCKCSPGRESNA